jgi:alcohol dehydrogenase class IV
MQFEFSSPAKILFGSGRLNSISTLVKGFGNRVLVISGAPSVTTDRLLRLLELDHIGHYLVSVDQEPTVETVKSVLDAIRKTTVDTVIGLGGGSALDMAKTISALLTNPGDLNDYLEIIGDNQPLKNPSLPLIAIPTTAGTGSEATRNAVIGSPQHHVKVSLRGPHLLPRIALVDPELAQSLPPNITATTGLDALTQLIEPFTCNNPSPMTDALCREGFHLISRSLFNAFDRGDDLNAREDMSLAALFSGISLANSRLGAVHGLAGPIGGEISAPHGAICAALLTHVISTNLTALRIRSPGHDSLERYAEIGRLLTGNPSASADEVIQWVHAFFAHAGLKTLSGYGMNEAQFPNIIEKSMNSSSMKGNPEALTQAELLNILQMSL